MSTEFDKHTIPDFGRKLAHVEGIMGAYLPSHVFDSKVQEQTIDSNKFALSRLKSGKRMAANWELARFVSLFDLARYGFDYRLFLLPFNDFCDALRTAGVGSHGASVDAHLREMLRESVPQGERIIIRTDGRLNVGGIGQTDDGIRLPRLTPRDKVTLKVVLKPSLGAENHFLLLHDYPAGRAMSCLMPSLFAPVHQITGQTLILPQQVSGYLSFPVAGTAGYRCLYGIQAPFDLAALLGFADATSTVPDLTPEQVTRLVDLLRHLPAEDRAGVCVYFGEYLLQ